jgi:malonyl CoA-acyl carrier protein transacylase
MNCFMFPGQPLSPATTPTEDEDFAGIARMTEEIASLDLATLSWTKSAHSENVKLQVHGAAMSLYRNRCLAREGVNPAIVAEHSMGIYAALAACGAIAEEDAMELVYRIGVCFSRMGEVKEYSLGCVIGLTLEPLAAIAANNGVYMANLNTSRHFLLSGEAGGIADAMAEALATGAFSAKAFPCDAPLHTPLMEELSSPLTVICGDIRYREPAVPLLDHIGQKPLCAAEIPAFLVRELMLPVYWERSYLALKASGVEKFIEVGSGDSLRKYNRWIDSENRSGS